MPTVRPCPRCGAALPADPAAACPACAGAAPSATLSLPPDTDAAATGSGGATATGPAGSGADDVRVSGRVGRFEVRGLVGEGVFGEVYRAYDPRLDREVALKVAKPGAIGTAARVQRFVREAKAAANLRHPHIVPLYETGVDAGRYYLVAAFIEGRTLGGVIDEARARGGLPPPAAAALGRKLASALAYAHAEGVVHRDVKPDNVMIDGRGEPHLLDFGLAVRDDAGEERLTQTGALVGTPAYMSPEQARGDADRTGPASDQYSLGCVLYELLTGRTPFAGPREVQLLLHQTQDPAPPRRANPAVPRDLDTVVTKCLEKDPGRRYPDCRAVADDLRRWQEGEPVAARRVGAGERLARWGRRNPALAGAVAAVVLAMAVGTGVSVYFGVEANAQAGQARAAKERADDEAGKARDARDATAREAGRALAAEDTARREAGRARAAEDGARRDAAEAKRQKDAAEVAREQAERQTYAAQMGRSDSLVAAGRLSAAAVALRDTRWDFRGWEYGYLRERADAGALTFRGHRGWVWDVRFTPDGRRLVTGSADGTVRVWDVATGAELRVVATGHKDHVRSVAVSGDGRLLVTASWDGTARVFDAETGAAGPVLDRHQGGFVSDAQLTPDGRLAVTAGDDGTVRVTDARTGEQVRAWTPPGQPRVRVQTARLSAVGGWVASACSDGVVWVWHRRTGRLRTQLVHGSFASAACFSADGTKLLTAGTDRTAKLWDLDTGIEVRGFTGHTDEIRDVTFSPDGSRVATASADGTVRLWDAATGEQVGATPDAGAPMNAARFSPDGAWLATASEDMTVRLWPAGLPRRPTARKAHTYEIPSLSFRPDGGAIATGSWDGTAAVWDATTGTRLLVLGGQAGRVRATGYSPDGREVAVSDEKVVRLRSAATGATRVELIGHRQPVVGLAYSPDGNTLVSGSEDATVRLWDTRTGAPVGRPLTGHDTWVYGVCFSPDGRYVASGSGDRTARIWDARTGEQVHVLRGHAAFVWSAAFSPDGGRLATGSWDGTIKLWDTADGTLRHTLRGHSGRVLGVAFQPDGVRLASAGGDKSVIIWDPATGTELCSLRPHGDGAEVTAVAFSPDGRVLASGGRDGTLAVSAGRFENEVAVVRRPARIASVAFAPDGSSLEARDTAGGVEAVRLPAGRPPGAAPPAGGPGVISPGGRFEARVEGNVVRVLARSHLTAGYDAWAATTARNLSRLPAWHAESAAAAELRDDRDAAAFHRHRLALLRPWDPLARFDAARTLAGAGDADRAALHVGAVVLDGLSRPAAVAATTWAVAAADPAVAARVRAGQGLLTERFAVAQAVPAADLEPLTDALGRGGYRPVRVRPYATPAGVRVAALWVRDGAGWRLSHGTSAEQLRATDIGNRAEGFRPVDVAAWHDGPQGWSADPFVAALGGPAGRAAAVRPLRYSAVWEPAGGTAEGALLLGVPAARLRAAAEPLREAANGPRSVQAVWTPGEGERYSMVWDPAVTEWNYWWRMTVPQYRAERRPRLGVSDVTVGTDRDGEVLAAAVWGAAGAVEEERPTGLTPAAHLARMRGLAAAGWRPVAVSVADGPDGPVAASVWHRPVAPGDQ